MELDMDVDLVADRLADLLEGRQRLPQVRGRDVGAVRALRIGIERPNLHTAIALGNQAFGERAGIVEEAVQILVRLLLLPLRRQTPVGDELLGLGTDVTVAGTGIVGANRVAALAAEKLPDRLLRH